MKAEAAAVKGEVLWPSEGGRSVVGWLVVRIDRPNTLIVAQVFDRLV